MLIYIRGIQEEKMLIGAACHACQVGCSFSTRDYTRDRCRLESVRECSEPGSNSQITMHFRVQSVLQHNLKITVLVTLEYNYL